MKETKQHRRKLQRKNELSEDKVVIRVWVRGVKSFETKYHTLNIKQDARNMLTAFVRLGIWFSSVCSLVPSKLHRWKHSTKESSRCLIYIYFCLMRVCRSGQPTWTLHTPVSQTRGKRYEDFTEVRIQDEVFWVVTCCTVVRYQHLGGSRCLHLPQDAGSTVLRNAGILLQHYTTTQLRRVGHRRSGSS